MVAIDLEALGASGLSLRGFMAMRGRKTFSLAGTRHVSEVQANGLRTVGSSIVEFSDQIWTRLLLWRYILSALVQAKGMASFPRYRFWCRKSLGGS